MSPHGQLPLLAPSAPHYDTRSGYQWLPMVAWNIDTVNVCYWATDLTLDQLLVEDGLLFSACNYSVLFLLAHASRMFLLYSGTP